jgi:type IV secretion system protein VirB5
MRKTILFPVIFLVPLMGASAHAQWAVIDVAAVARLSTEVRTLEQALTTEQQTLADTREQLAAMTGSRGMSGLLANVRRNYLPGDWRQLSAALEGDSASYGTLVAGVRTALAEDAVLSPAQLGALSQPARAQILAERRTTALLQAISREALANSSGRFALLQQLIDAIGRAHDQKAILDLTARIAAEQAMLENEQTKLRVLFATAEAERWADELRAHERDIAAQGDFATRFQPTP